MIILFFLLVSLWPKQTHIQQHFVCMVHLGGEAAATSCMAAAVRSRDITD